MNDKAKAKVKKLTPLQLMERRVLALEVNTVINQETPAFKQAVQEIMRGYATRIDQHQYTVNKLEKKYLEIDSDVLAEKLQNLSHHSHDLSMLFQLQVTKWSVLTSLAWVAGDRINHEVLFRAADFPDSFWADKNGRPFSRTLRDWTIRIKKAASAGQPSKAKEDSI